MSQSAKLLWGEGLFLRPQHFQRQDAYHERRLAHMAGLLSPYAWGLVRLEVDADALARRVLRVTALRAVLSDGELLDAPRDDELPPPVSLADLPAGQAECVFHLVLPEMREHARNMADRPEQAQAHGLRFVHQKLQAASDWFTDAEAAQFDVLRRQPRLLADHEPREAVETLPLLRVRRLGSGAYELDPGFVPPSLHLASSAGLPALLRRVLDALQAKAEALAAQQREPSRHVVEFRSGDSALYWLLHTANTAFAALAHLHQHPAFHPERLHERLAELAGGLMTFSRRHRLGDLPPYDHLAPGPGFARLADMVIDLLETVIPMRHLAITLSEVERSYYQGRLESGHIGAETRLVLGVHSAMGMTKLVDAVPRAFLVGSPEDLRSHVDAAVVCVPLVHAPQVPPAIPVRPDMGYFNVDPGSPLYERMLKSQTIKIYVPAGFPEIRLELFAVNP